MYISVLFQYLSLFLFFSTMNKFRSTALLWRLFFSHKIWIHISWKCFTSSHLFVRKNLFLNRQNYWTFWVTGYIVEVMELRWFGLQWNKLVVWCSSWTTAYRFQKIHTNITFIWMVTSPFHGYVCTVLPCLLA